MKTTLFALLLALAVASTQALATDLRGRVQINSQYRPQPIAQSGIAVRLFSEKGPKQWAQLRSTLTESDGMYYFQGVAPGVYALQVGGANFRLEVLPQPLQDITPVTIQR